MLNSMSKFGVKQRCLKGNQSINELMLLSLHYTQDVNYYISDDNFNFLGIINKKMLLEADLSADNISKIKLMDICSKSLNEIVYLEGDEILFPKLNRVFCNTPATEVAIIQEDTNCLIGIISRQEFFNEEFIVKAENDDEIIIYRDFSHTYVPHKENLNKFAYNINSQHGEDGIINAVFDKIGTTTKFAVEFGGWDGIYLSNIRNLIVSKGFSGLFIEGNSEKADQLKKNYLDFPQVHCVESYVGLKKNLLDDILIENNVPKSIDLISIDIDGYDYHVWDTMHEYRPRIIVIEYNPSIPNEIILINPYSEDIFTGSSAAALVELGRKKGYSLIAVTQTNLIFIVDEEFEKLEIWDNSLQTLRPIDRLSDGKFFQTYNKKIIISGFNAYIWSGENFSDSENEFIFNNL